ncbi:unnamed protein product [Oikopleura dioica]|nr:unnamed protein product [Oikopleura dioica]
MTKSRRTVDQIRRDRFLRRGPGGLLSQKDKENLGYEQESFNETGDSHWSDITASVINDVIMSVTVFILCKEIELNVGKRKSETITAGNSNWEISDEQSTLRNEDTKSPPAKRRSSEAKAAEEIKKEEKEKRERENKEKMAKVNAFHEKWKKEQADIIEHNRKVDEYMAEREEKKAAREERKKIKEEKRAEKLAAKEARAKERFRLQQQMTEEQESTAENEKNDLTEENEETRTIVPENLETYLVEQQIEPSSDEPSNRTYTIEKAPGNNDPKSPGVSRTINSSEISVFSPKENSTPLRSKEVFQEPKRPTRLAKKMDPSVKTQSSEEKSKIKQKEDATNKENEELGHFSEETITLQRSNKSEFQKTISTKAEKKKRGRPKKVKSIPTPEIRESKDDADSYHSDRDTHNLDSPELMIDEEFASTSDEAQELFGTEQQVVEATGTKPEQRKRSLSKELESNSPSECLRKKKGANKEANSKKSSENSGEEKRPESHERHNLSHSSSESELDPGIIEASLGDEDVPVYDDNPPVIDKSNTNVSESDDEIPPRNKTKKGRRKSARFSSAPDQVRTFEPNQEEHLPKSDRKKNAKKVKRRSVVARDDIRHQRCESPDASILLDYVIEQKTPPVGVRRSRRIRLIPGSRPPTNDLTDIQPMLTEDQIKKGDFGFLKEIDLHRQITKKKDKSDPFTMRKYQRMKLYGGFNQEEQHDEIWAEAKLKWELGSIAGADNVVKKENGTTYKFLSSEKKDKWRFGCAPGAKTHLAIHGLEYASFYIKTNFASTSMGLSKGSLLFSKGGKMEESTEKNEYLSFTVLYGEIKLITDKGKSVFKAGESFDILPKTKYYQLMNTRTSTKLTELEWERMTSCDFRAKAAKNSTKDD